MNEDGVLLTIIVIIFCLTGLIAKGCDSNHIARMRCLELGMEVGVNGVCFKPEPKRVLDE